MTSFKELDRQYSYYEQYTYREIEEGLNKVIEASAEFDSSAIFTIKVTTTISMITAYFTNKSTFKANPVKLIYVKTGGNFKGTSSLNTNYIHIMRYLFITRINNGTSSINAKPLLIKHLEDRYVNATAVLQKEYVSNAIINKEYDCNAIINKVYDVNLVFNSEYTANITLNIA